MSGVTNIYSCVCQLFLVSVIVTSEHVLVIFPPDCATLSSFLPLALKFWCFRLVFNVPRCLCEITPGKKWRAVACSYSLLLPSHFSYFIFVCVRARACVCACVRVFLFFSFPRLSYVVADDMYITKAWMQEDLR